LANNFERLFLVIFALLAVLPIGLSLIYSGAYALGLTGLLSEGFTLQHWQKAFTGSEIPYALINSLYVAGLTVVITVLISLALALNVRRRLDRGLLSYAVYLPLALPTTVAAFLMFQLLSDAGFFMRLLAQVGLIADPGDLKPLIHDPFSVGVIAAHLLLAVPYFTLLFRQIFRDTHVGELLRLTYTLGGTPWDGLTRVTLPILLRAGLSNIMLLFVSVLGSYEIPLLLGKQSPQMLSVMTMRKYQLFDLSEKPQAFIVALIYSVAVVLVLFAVFRRRRRVGHV
jgi:putative spermidine/putrescine transport system permease protein